MSIVCAVLSEISPLNTKLNHAIPHDNDNNAP